MYENLNYFDLISRKMVEIDRLKDMSFIQIFIAISATNYTTESFPLRL